VPVHDFKWKLLLKRGDNTPQPYSNVVSYNKTASDDDPFRIVLTDLWLREANIHCTSNDALYGTATDQQATLSAGDILVFEKFNLGDLYFKNANAGSNTVLYVVGIALTKKEIKELLGA